jgi:hypothetical protein
MKTMKVILSVCVAMALFACGSSKTVERVDETDPAWEGPPPEAFGSLDESDLAEACEVLSGHYMCADCSCTGFGNAVGKGRIQISGIDMEGGEVEAEADIVEGDDGWRLAKEP